MTVQRMSTRNSARKTRYVFAGTEDVGKRTKTCPRCGEELFEDMDICYGCLYDFSRDRRGDVPRANDEGAGPLERLQAVPKVNVTSEFMDIDEIDDDPVRPPRHSREAAASADDTLDLASINMPSDPPREESRQQEDARPYSLIVRAEDLFVRLPIDERGVTVGRDEANDVVLRSRSVSRRHVRVFKSSGGVLAEDLQATNPARLRDEPLVGSEHMGRGDVLDVCGTLLELA